MSDGYINIRTSVYNDAKPIRGARVYIKKSNGNISNLPYNPQNDVSADNYDYYTVTGEDGKSPAVRLQAPNLELSFGYADAQEAYTVFDVFVIADNYVPAFIRGAQIFPNLQSEIPLSLEPYVSTLPPNYVRTFDIPQNAVVEKPQRERTFAENGIETDVLPEIVIPSSIVVHLGDPRDNGVQNITVPFTEYIKNVASSEIFPTWDEEAIRANIYAQISLALNRIYTEWYPSQGYSFQITNSTRYDQAYVDGRNIFDNIGMIVDEAFNTFLRKDGNYEPFFAQYCDGVRTNCDGMSQWGSRALAERGYNALGILKNYYGDSIEIVRTDNIADIPYSYSGTPLSLGSVGEDVLRIQIQLDRIRNDYPLIPKIERLNGRFGTETDSAVRTFQSVFDLNVDGIVGKATWYKISRIYSAVTRLGEITSEGTETYIPDEPPKEILRIGATGDNVRLAQFMLEYLSFFYQTVSTPLIDGYFGKGTEDSVIGFQKTFGLNPDGIIGTETWDALYSASSEINNLVQNENEEERYPGAPLGVGARGRNVEIMKIYYNKIAEYYGELPTVNVNSVYDEEFANDIRMFQEQYGLEPDGIIGALTWTRIVELSRFIDNVSQSEPENSEEESIAVFSSSRPSHEYPGIKIRRGVCGRHVKYVQDALNTVCKKYGIKKYLNVNGEYGAETENAVRNYQKRRGMNTDGVVDMQLWNRLICESDSFKKENLQ